MKFKLLAISTIGILLTCTGILGFSSTAFSKNLQDLKVGELKNLAVASSPELIADFSFVDSDGNKLTMSDFRGKVILLNFWATWCGPCRKEMPSIDRLQAEMGSDAFQVIALSHDLKGITQVEKFYKKYKIKHLEVYNDKTLVSGRETGVFGLPATLIIDKKGNEVARLVGPAEWDTDEAKALIQAVIDLN